MAILPTSFEQHLAANPDGRYTVIITLLPGVAEAANPLRRLAGPAVCEAIDGLPGFFRATLPGRDILALHTDPAVQSIDPDDLPFYALG